MKRNASSHYPYLAAQFCSMLVRECETDFDIELLVPHMLNRMCCIPDLTNRLMSASEMIKAMEFQTNTPNRLKP